MNSKRIKPVSQLDPFGCGIACVAVATNLNYGEAKLLFFNKSLAKTKGYLCKDLILALSKKGLIYKLKIYKKYKGIVEEGDIVFISKDLNYPYGHFLIKKGSYWVDSWLNLPNLPVKSGLRLELPGDPKYLIKKL